MKYTQDAVTEALEKIIAEKGGDYLYPPAQAGTTCTYVEQDGTPSCIVGHIIAALDPEGFQAIREEEEATGGSTDVATALREWAEADIDTELIRALQEAQNKQDAAGTWGEAFDVYRGYLG